MPSPRRRPGSALHGNVIERLLVQRTRLHQLVLGERPHQMGESYESVTVEISERVARVTLIGPGKGNTMGPAFFSEMPDVFATLDADPDVRAIVLTGSGRNFS